MVGTLIRIDYKKNAFSGTKYFDEKESIKELCKVLSIVVNRKKFKTLYHVHKYDNDYKRKGVIINLHYKDNRTDVVDRYTFKGDDIDEYYFTK